MVVTGNQIVWILGFFENPFDIIENNSLAFSNSRAADDCLNVCSGTSSQLFSGNDNPQATFTEGEHTQNNYATGAENVLAAQPCSTLQSNSVHAPMPTCNMAPDSTERQDTLQIPPVDTTAEVNDSTDEENEHIMEKESYICAVCLDVYFIPYMCNPCQRIFCEPCLRTIAKDNPTKMICPLYRTTVAQVCFQSDLNKSSLAFFPNEYSKRKECFQRTNYSKWPLPNSNRMFRGFGGFSRHLNGRGYPHSGHRQDFKNENWGWRLEIGMNVIYVYTVNWIIGFIIFCFICYFLNKKRVIARNMRHCTEGFSALRYNTHNGISIITKSVARLSQLMLWIQFTINTAVKQAVSAQSVAETVKENVNILPLLLYVVTGL
ncbi:hypothetical protein XELAEV_18008238mg [Xenopus laevis]|uniref:RING-type domain-containing protein n=1 Tax=Xenopus laevis TaxID=8355 RepID=A0A974E2W5_XENLA|nr:hypothetical protein XELAEV_18008238mg [Xenopus laevis]